MKWILIIVCISLTEIVFHSCKKEISCENCLPQNNPTNKPPVANAGPDQAITLPVNSVTLDGSKSSNPDNNITTYAWTKISGPPVFTIPNANAVQTAVTNLVQGTYLFELKVTDCGGLYSKDRIYASH